MGVISSPPAIWTLSADTTLSPDDCGLWHFINCSSSANLTLPTAAEGLWIGLQNYGTGTITVKNAGGTTIGSVYQYFTSLVQTWPDASGVPAWPTKIAIQGSSNLAHVNNDFVFLDAAKGIVLKDAAGTPHYWRVTISTLGVLTTSDLGTSPPTTESAPA